MRLHKLGCIQSRLTTRLPSSRLRAAAAAATAAAALRRPCCRHREGVVAQVVPAQRHVRHDGPVRGGESAQHPGHVHLLHGPSLAGQQQRSGSGAGTWCKHGGAAELGCRAPGTSSGGRSTLGSGLCMLSGARPKLHATLRRTSIFLLRALAEDAWRANKSTPETGLSRRCICEAEAQRVLPSQQFLGTAHCFQAPGAA